MQRGPGPQAELSEGLMASSESMRLPNSQRTCASVSKYSVWVPNSHTAIESDLGSKLSSSDSKELLLIPDRPWHRATCFSHVTFGHQRQFFFQQKIQKPEYDFLQVATPSSFQITTSHPHRECVQHLFETLDVSSKGCELRMKAKTLGRIWFTFESWGFLYTMYPPRIEKSHWWDFLERRRLRPSSSWEDVL